MYGKIFEQMYDGTLRASWQALVTFQQLIVLCNEDGVIDMTASAIAGRTGIPLDIIEPGIEFLEQPDPYSRTPDQEGRRLERLDAHRPWGWRIVNYVKYRDMLRREEKKAADRDRIAAKRAQERGENTPENNDVAGCRAVSQKVANVAHTDTEVSKTGTNVPAAFAAKGDPPPIPIGGPPDPLDVIWKTGAHLLTASGIAEVTARSFLGMLCKQHGEVAVAEKIAALAVQPVAEPRAWLKGALNGTHRESRPSSAAARVDAANPAIPNAAAGHRF